MARVSLISSVIGFAALAFILVQMMMGVYEGGESAIVWGGVWAVGSIIGTVLAIVALIKNTASRRCAILSLLIAWVPPVVLVAISALWS